MDCNAGAEDEPWLTIFWDVENYSDYAKERNRCISSPTFRVESIEKSAWDFSLYPQGRNDEDYISYMLNGSLSVVTSEVNELEFEVAILAEDETVLKIRDRHGTCYRLGSPRCLETFVLREEVTNTKRETFLSRDTLRTRCRLWRTSGKVDAPLTFFGRTALKEEKRNFTGYIKHFSSLDYSSRPIYQSFHNTVFTKPYFSINMRSQTEIQIKISLKDMDVTYLAIHFLIRHTNGSETDCKKLKIWPNEGEEEIVYTLPFTKQHVIRHKNLFLVSDVLWIFCKLYLKSLKQCVSYTPFVSLTCNDNKNHEIKVFDGEKIDLKITSPSNSIIPNGPIVKHNASTSDLKEDFEHLYSKGILSDVTLRTASETFHAHKTILSARSPVFLAMFTTDMKESMQNDVDVSDLEDDSGNAL
ncbi:hypothetical protein TNIN_385681 [Trichonephila inaurata madagascariensis]|uniref:Uncharacterized protein n=1 Tax=Trichonephila inaurata madagascariensis TaxID=2747483 RepID=A0A8X6WLS4_9ARAC|nr:hypothetical protein TNIN_385681 [Trichonephila inaurata madagascariensis]